MMINRNMLLLVACLYCGGSLAQSRGDDGFDRIFTTPEERRALDEYRRTGLKAETGSGSKPPRLEAAVEVRETDRVRFSGYVLRSDGSQMIWVDGRSELSGDESGVAGASHGRVRRGRESVNFQARANQANLKAGQLWLLNENEVLETYDAPAVAPAPSVEDESLETE